MENVSIVGVLNRDISKIINVCGKSYRVYLVEFPDINKLGVQYTINNVYADEFSSISIDFDLKSSEDDPKNREKVITNISIYDNIIINSIIKIIKVRDFLRYNIQVIGSVIFNSKIYLAGSRIGILNSIINKSIVSTGEKSFKDRSIADIYLTADINSSIISESSTGKIKDIFGLSVDNSIMQGVNIVNYMTYKMDDMDSADIIELNDSIVVSNKRYKTEKSGLKYDREVCIFGKMQRIDDSIFSSGSRLRYTIRKIINRILDESL